MTSPPQKFSGEARKKPKFTIGIGLTSCYSIVKQRGKRKYPSEGRTTMEVSRPYTRGFVNTKPCPFCGRDDTVLKVAGDMSLHRFYCQFCKIEVTIDERKYIKDNGEVVGIENFTAGEAIEKWESRADEQRAGCCPFCGSGVEEWPWGHYLFDSLYCPTCKKRFQFQSHPTSKRSMTRTMREFNTREGNNAK